MDNLFLLETHQIATLPDNEPHTPALAAVLHSRPALWRFFVVRHPPIEAFLGRVLADHDPVEADELEVRGGRADVGVRRLDCLPASPRTPNAAQVDGITAVARDRGARREGGGRCRRRHQPGGVLVAPIARHVYAMSRLPRCVATCKTEATRLGLDNLFVLDGFLNVIPLPTGSADVLLTCQAIGWALAEELAEIERVVRPAESPCTSSGLLVPNNPTIHSSRRCRPTGITRTPSRRGTFASTAIGSRSDPEMKKERPMRSIAKIS